MGASCAGTTTFSHGRTPVLSWGMTAVNPDVSDIFVETIKDGTHYLVGDGEWEPIMESHETIKVKGKPDLTHVTYYTRNGALLPPDLLEGSAKDMMPWISSDLLFSDEVDGVNKIYAMANVYDPLSVRRFESEYDYANADWAAMVHNKSLRAEDVPGLYNSMRMPSNCIIGLEKTGELVYTTTGKFPIRKHHTIQGSYPKLGHIDDNMW